MQVRCNRLLWSYEATRVETEHDQDEWSGSLNGHTVRCQQQLANA